MENLHRGEPFLEVPCNDPQFFSATFSKSLAATQEDLCILFDIKQEWEMSLWLDATGVQESFGFRAKRRAVLLAEYLIQEDGNISVDKVSQVLGILEKKGHIPYPGGLCDTVITEHFLQIARKLEREKPLVQMIQKFQVPLCHLWAEQLIRETLGLPSEVPLTHRHIRVAVLSACLTVLRQNVGSCFATAPAIIIQSEQTGHLVKDLYDLLTTGKLKRTFGGIESSVPLSPSSGAGDLYKTLEGTEKSLQSPGLTAAWKIGGITDPISLVQKCFPSFFERGESIRIVDLIHGVFLAHFGLEPEDLVAHTKKQKVLAKQSAIAGIVGGKEDFAKMQLCDDMLRKEEQAKAAFKALTHHALLKAWEFTLASFSEGKMEFSRWNLYSSLGLDNQEKGGIGDVLHRALQGKLDENNAKVEEYHQDYLIAFDQLRATESLLQRASTESDIKRLKAEFNTRLYHMQSCQSRRDECQLVSSQYAAFFTFLIQAYNDKFQEYFQEIYDAQMQDVKAGLYEDSPAGFRLVYKHGRTNASTWTMIYTAEEYIDSLADFFHTTEAQIAADSDWDQAPQVLTDLTTAVISHVRTQEFLETSIFRMAKVHGMSVSSHPLKELDKLEKKPWSYTSGGNMSALLQMYYRQETPIREEVKWVENETHLGSFIIDTLKNLPNVEIDKGMLFTSPSHAFILYPGWEEVYKGWQDPIFTYSWVRDQVLAPQKIFYEKMTLSFEEQQYLCQELMRELPFSFAQRLRGEIFSSNKVSIQMFRQQVIQSLHEALKDKVDSFLYENLPLIQGSLWKPAAKKILTTLLPSFSTEQMLSDYPDTPSSFLTARQVRDMAKAVYVSAQNSVMFPVDIHQIIAKQASLLGFAPPSAFVFGDTNWTNYYFGLVVNPGTLQLELWRLDKTGQSGFPMSSWKKWFDGTEKKEWHIFSHPMQYR